LEDFWEDIKSRGYYILGISLIIFIPFILEVNGTFPKIPIISDLYAIGRDSGIFGKNTYVLKIISLCAIWAIFAASWDFLSGYTGQVSFGHGIFWGFSAYLTYWIATGDGLPLNDIKIPIFDEFLFFLSDFINGILNGLLTFVGESELTISSSVFRAIILSGIFSALLAGFIGIIALRVKGPYLALITLILPLIASNLVLILADITKGNFGISFISGPFLIEKTFPVNRELDALNFYIVIMFFFLIAIGLLMLIAFSRIGLAFQSIREDEDAAESLGINLRFYKILAFAGSAFFAGIAGSMYSQYISFTGPSFFDASYSFGVIIMCVVGGISTITGGVIGAFSLTILLSLYLDQVFHGVDGLNIVAYGALLILSLRYMRFGLVRSDKDQKKGIVLGIFFALSWAILPSSTGWGVDLFSNFLPSFQDKPLSGDFLGYITYIFSDVLTQFVGKIDSLGQMFTSLGGENLLTFVGLLLLFIITIPAIPIFILSEILGLVLLEGILGLHFSSTTVRLKAKFLLYLITGIPYAYYLPKLFKKIRLRYWGTWPSAGRYEPD
jgi:branched-chain amino acid transport system permease protein